eukprot:scaffold1626_cov372-Prasinococcus_capsulatus_cf.AAC.3
MAWHGMAWHGAACPCPSLFWLAAQWRTPAQRGRGCLGGGSPPACVGAGVGAWPLSSARMRDVARAVAAVAAAAGEARARSQVGSREGKRERRVRWGGGAGLPSSPQVNAFGPGARGCAGQARGARRRDDRPGGDEADHKGTGCPCARRQTSPVPLRAALRRFRDLHVVPGIGRGGGGGGGSALCPVFPVDCARREL